MSFDVIATPGRSSRISFLPCRILALPAALLIAHLAASAAMPPPHPPQADQTDKAYYANAHPYFEKPLAQLLQLIPELSTLQPAPNQQPLPTILQNTAEHVDEFFQNVVDLTCHETITEAKLDDQGSLLSRQQLDANYLILRRGSPVLGGIDEYRMDANGNGLIDAGLNKGYFVTSNFALIPIYFSTDLQHESTFRYLGQQQIASHDTYVVAFAQIPGETSSPVVLAGERTSGDHYLVRMLIQGIAWIDKNNFQILRMRTDLLVPRPEVGLDSLTTVVTPAPVQLPDTDSPLNLPRTVQVSAHFTEVNSYTGGPYDVNFRNEHRYSDYQRYRVSTRMIPDANSGSGLDLAEPGKSNLVMSPAQAAQSYYSSAHPYFELPMEELVKQIPELKKIRPPVNQEPLHLVLEKAGGNVDEFFHHVVDLIAREKITQERVGGTGFSSSERLEDNYLILRQPNDTGNEMVEYRMDANGNRLDHLGIGRGYLVTFGFALLSNYFSTAYQDESVFHYLGDEKIGPRDTYVVAFAQKPGEATQFVTMATRTGVPVRMLMQGIAWIDKTNFQILRLRTDLLAPRPEVSLDRQTTEVTFSPVRLQDVSTTLWLPQDVKVFLGIKESMPYGLQRLSFRNEHHYSDYRRYRVSVKIVPPQ
jgi:hypothetical protein